jgi:hypothetical protein
VHDTFERIHSELRKRGITPVYYVEHHTDCSMNLEWVDNNVHSLLTFWTASGTADFDVVNESGTIQEITFEDIRRFELEAEDAAIGAVDNIGNLIAASAVLNSVKAYLESQGL